MILKESGEMGKKLQSRNCKMTENVMQYLDSLNSLGSVPGLDSISTLLDRLGNPQNKIKFVHIAGTNGKGSVNAFVSSILMEAGYRTGRFVSPAVMDPLEIIQVDNNNITLEEYGDIVSRIKTVCDAMTNEGLPHPTRFEIETAAGFIFFMEKKCDIAVVECGMGGLLDSTNIIKNTLCSVITSLSIDHTGFLGNTIEEIAAHKAGIIKPDGQVVALRGMDNAMKIIINKAKETGQTVNFAEPDAIKIVKTSLEGIIFNYKNYSNIHTGLIGVYQPVNAAIAVECAMALRKKAIRISDNNIYEGIRKASWAGRFQLLGTKPDFIIDGAHNPDGALKLSQCLDRYFPDGGLTYIMGVFADKDYETILQYVMPYCKSIYTIETPDNKRALSSKILADFIKKHYDIPVCSCDSIKEGITKAISVTNEDGAIIAFGSLSHLSQITKEYNIIRTGCDINDR